MTACKVQGWESETGKWETKGYSSGVDSRFPITASRG
jgi:hypothetical protein